MTASPPARSGFQTILLSLGLVLLISAVVTSVYFFQQYMSAQKRLRDVAGVEDQLDTIERIKKLMIVPDDERPTVTSVDNLDDLRGQAFFSKAQNGDKLIVYKAWKKAILYRPSENKIVEVGSLNAPTPVAATASAQAAGPSFTIAVRTGTQDPSLAPAFIELVRGSYPNATLVEVEPAKRTDHAASLIVDISGTRASAAGELARRYNLTSAPLPSQESSPEADFLVILGSDRTSQSQ